MRNFMKKKVLIPIFAVILFSGCAHVRNARGVPDGTVVSLNDYSTKSTSRKTILTNMNSPKNASPKANTAKP